MYLASHEKVWPARAARASVIGAAALLLAACQTGSPPSSTAARNNPAKSSEVNLHPDLPPEVQAAVAQLGSPDAATRRAALENVTATLSAYMGQAAFIQRLADEVRANIAAELQAFTAQHDPEVAARMARVLAYNEGLANFTMAVLDAPADQREALIRWGFSPSGRPGATGSEIIGLAFSGRVADRVAGAAALATVSGDQADWVLSRLIDDDEREVSLAAMDAVWDRAPAPEVVEMLWRKAVVYPLAVNGYRLASDSTWEPTNNGNVQQIIRVGDRTVQIYDGGYAAIHAANRAADADVATDILLDYRTPQVSQKLDKLFGMLAEARSQDMNLRNTVLSLNYGGAALSVQRLVQGYRPHSAVVVLVQMVLNPGSDGWENGLGAQMFRTSSRIDALAMLIKLTDMDKDDFKLVRRPEYGNRWLIAGRAEDEEAAVKKIRAWWTEHKKEYTDQPDPPLVHPGPPDRMH